MHTVGIICEYNPLHTGHIRQMREVRERLGGDAEIVCAMSGNFVQRGEFALVEKHVRAEAAVRGGADLVLEIPTPWATSSAEGFARGGAEVLRGVHEVDTLAFGSECADTAALRYIAECLDGEAYAACLREELASGASFALCRRAAVGALLGEEYAALLDGANNNLGVEYIRALRGSAIEPLALRRYGVRHDGGAVGEYASASHIRSLLQSGENADSYLAPDMARLYKEECAARRAPVRMETLERAVLAKLRMMRQEEFAAFDEGREGLCHRLYDASRTAAGVEEVLALAKTKRYAHARLRRMVLRIFLGIANGDVPAHVPYLRVLACNVRGRAILRRMKETATLPILTKSAAIRDLPEPAQRLFALEARASDLYALACPAPMRGGSEWTTGPVIVK